MRDRVFFSCGDGQDAIVGFESGTDMIEIGSGAKKLRDSGLDSARESVVVSLADVQIRFFGAMIEDLRDLDHFLF